MQNNAMSMPEHDWDQIVEALQQQGVLYLTGGSGWDQPVAPASDLQPETLQESQTLLRVLAGSRHARLRDAVIALLLLHPDYAGSAQTLLAGGSLSPAAHNVLQSRLIAAACLQRLWRFTLSIYRPGQPLIPADVVEGTGLPSPDEDYGRPCFRALIEGLATGEPFPFNYGAEFARVADLVLADLIAEANHAA